MQRETDRFTITGRDFNILLENDNSSRQKIANTFWALLM